MHRIYKKDKYAIYETEHCGYILQNILMPDFAHTHLNNFKTAKFLAELSIHKRVPNHLSRYLLISLLRVNDDEKYLRRIEELLEKEPKDKYVNGRCKR